MKKAELEHSSETEIGHLVECALAHLDVQRYRPATIVRKRCAWEAFAQIAGDEPFSVKLVHGFLADRGVSEDADGSSLANMQRETRTAMRQLTDFKLHGFFQRRGPAPETVSLSAPLADIRRGYVSFCRDRLGHRPQTLKQRKRFITRFLSFIEARKITSMMEIDVALLSAFVIQHAHLKPKSVGAICGSLRSLLRYLCMGGLVAADLKLDVPAVRIPRDAHIPGRWLPEEVEALLAVVDRSSPLGKRDYAILLLAARFGMRAGDIRGLQIEHVRWDEEKIEFIQEKTRASLSLPLTDEVGTALIDYLRCGRPTTPHRDVFLRLIPPFAPFASSSALCQIITAYRRRAGIKIPRNRTGGMHALRHSLASRLLEAGTPLETISHIMGHLSPASTQIYAKVGIENLRGAALDWEFAHE